MEATKLEELVEIADEELAADPDSFEPPQVMQPGSVWRAEAEDLLGDDAPWHRVVVVAHALRDEDEQLADERYG